MPSAETLAPMADEYLDPMNHQEPKYAEVGSAKTESKINFWLLKYIFYYFYFILEYDVLDYLQQNTKNHLSYDKLKIMAEEIQKIQ